MPKLSGKILVAIMALAGVTSALGQAAPQPTPLTIVIDEAGPAWKHGRPFAEQNLGPHFGYVASLFKRGKIIAYGTEAGDVVRGYYLLSGSGKDVAASFVGNDPGVKEGVLKPAETHIISALVNAIPAKEDNQAYTILRMQPGPKWVEGKPLAEQDTNAHFGFMIEQAKVGIVIAAAPDASGQEGWYILRGDKTVAAKLLASDPATKSGVLKPIVLGWNVVGMQPAK
jgi:hypothetical protein